MCSRLMVIGEVAGEDAVEVTLAEDENVMKTLAPDRTDQALRKGVLPRAVRRCEHLLDPHALHAVPKWLTVDLVTVAEKKGRGGVFREGVHELLGGPVGGGVLGHVEVEDPAAVVSEHDEDEEDAEARGGHGEKVDRDHVADVVGEERPPGLRGLGAALRNEAGDGALGDVDAELEELAVDAGRPPQAIRRGHFPDEGGDLGIDGRAASRGPTGPLSPVHAEASALPSQDGVGGHDDQSMPPAGPDSGQPDPQQAVGRAQPRPGRRSLVDGELLAQGQVLKGELTRAADEEGEEAEQVEEEGDHRAEIVSGSEPIDQPLAHRTEFWRRTGLWRGAKAPGGRCARGSHGSASGRRIRDDQRATPRPEEWLLIEWPPGNAEPTKYWLSTLPETIPVADLVRLAKRRWRIERDDQELQDELGLDHFEGRGWRGFQHHGALCIAAYAFLAAERGTLSPPEPLAFLRPARLPKGFTPRGAPGAD